MEEKRLKDESPISTLEKSRKRKGRKPGYKKTGGRVKGTPNKKTVYLNDILNNSDFDFATKLSEVFEELPLNDKLSLLKEMFPYIAPKLNSKDVSDPAPESESTADILKIVKK